MMGAVENRSMTQNHLPLSNQNQLLKAVIRSFHAPASNVSISLYLALNANVFPCFSRPYTIKPPLNFISHCSPPPSIVSSHPGLQKYKAPFPLQALHLLLPLPGTFSSPLVPTTSSFSCPQLFKFHSFSSSCLKKKTKNTASESHPWWLYNRVILNLSFYSAGYSL